MLGIDRNIKVNENVLMELMNQQNSVEKIWTERRITSYSHVSRLPFDNPARIVIFGSLLTENINDKREFFNVKCSIMKDLKKLMDNETLCNLCDRKIRSTDLYMTSG